MNNRNNQNRQFHHQARNNNVNRPDANRDQRNPQQRAQNGNACRNCVEKVNGFLNGTGAGAWFIVKTLVKSVIKISNFSILLQRFLTIVLVIAYYQFVEKIEYLSGYIEVSQEINKGPLRQNEMAFIKFILFWHLIFMNMKIGSDDKRYKYARFQQLIFGLCFGFGVISVVIVLCTPILAWFNYEITKLDSSFWSLRYLMMFLYIVFNFLLSLFPHVHNFLFFVTDGIILSQLTSLYLYNEFSMSALLAILPVLFVIHNHLLVSGIQSFVKHEKSGKMSFVRLIGRHDAVFLFVIYSMFTAIFTIIDIFSANFAFSVNLWYILYALYAFAKLMDHKQSQGKWLYRLSLLTVIVFIGVYVWSLKLHKNPFPQREFPLYKEIVQNLNETENGNSTVDENITSELNLTIGQNITVINQEVIIQNEDVVNSDL